MTMTILFGLLAATLQTGEPGVPKDLWLDCEHKPSINEVGVCDDPELMAIDNAIRKEFDRQYGAATNRDERNSIIHDQRQFRDTARFCEGEPPCLRPLYDRRLAEIKEGSAPDQPPPAAER